MRTDAELKGDAMILLRTSLGLVDSERFIALIQREQFDYTKWRRDHWKNASVSQLAEQARQMRSSRQ